MSNEITERMSARDRLLAAADELFYNEGVHSVGIDRVIAHAGVAKASLYSAFGSKDELIRCYLARRQAALQERIEGRLALCGTPKERLLAIFDMVVDLVKRPRFRGCAFVNARAEAVPGSTLDETCVASRDWVRSRLVGLAEEAHAAHPDRLAQQLLLLYDGALVSATMNRNPEMAETARGVAETLIDAALAGNAA
jgi:AcrR family transcriptional regulator